MNGYEAAARLLAGTRRAVGFSGAGISAESGIPTFRDPGGIWDQFDPEEFGTTAGILEVARRRPEQIRRFMLDTVRAFNASKPTRAHDALAELERMGIVAGIITQNIDNLHNDAGSKLVYDVHGNLFRARCITCGRRYPLDKAEFLARAMALLTDTEGFSIFKLIGLMPKCECGGMTRPDVVMFGEAVQCLNESFQLAGSCEVMLVLGTSGVVYPAAAMPHHAHEAGAKLIEINPHENSFGRISEVYIDEPSGEAMPKVMDKLRKLTGG
jgi:NAD-dependent deacetylase